MKRFAIFATMVLATTLLSPAPALAQTAPPLGPALPQFGVLGGAAVTGSTGAGTSVNGDVGSSPTPSVTTFPPSSTVSPFILHSANDATVQQAHLDAIAAYNNLVAQGPGTVLGPQLAGLTLTAGLYSFGAAADVAAGGTLTLNGPGIFIFSVGSALTQNVLSSVAGTANPCNVYWRIGSSATLNGNNFFGTVLADQSVTVASTNNVIGRVVGINAAVTMPGGGGNTIGGCSGAAAPPAVSTITLVNAAASGDFPAGTIFGGLALTGLEVSSGVEVGPTGTALGELTAILNAPTPLDPARTIVIEAQANAGSLSGANVAVFSGKCSVDMGDGTPPLEDVVFSATITADGSGGGTVALVIGATSLPVTPVDGAVNIRLR